MSLVPKDWNIDNIFENILPINKTRELKCDIYEQDGIYNIEMDVPDFKKEDISIDYEDGYIIITVEKELLKSDENKKYIRRERQTNEYKREFYIGNVDIDKAKARLKNGILSIQIPINEKMSNKKSIEIE